MQGLHGRVFLAVAVAMVTTSAAAQFADPTVEARQTLTPIPAYLREGSRAPIVDAEWIRPMVFQDPGARFIKLHFSRFELPEGVTVEVSNPDGSETWRYSADLRDLHTVDRERGDDGEQSFWAMSVSGDTAVVRLTGRLSSLDPDRHGFEIDTHFSDTRVEPDPVSRDKGATPVDSLETTCGEDERFDAVCWAGSHPDHYDRALPVALIVTTGGKQCTAWRVGSDNRMFTARHCIASQSALDGAEIWFDYEASMCGGDTTLEPVKVTGDRLLAQDYKLDFALFTVNDFSRIRGYGNLGLDLRDGTVGERIFIPQHGLGNPKQIAIESDMNVGGQCAIDDNAVDGFSEASDIGYMCDTTSSSSGAPVISGVTGRAIALHHWGGCFNSGTKLSRIWPMVSEYFNGVPDGDASGDWAEPNKAPVARYTTDCEGLSCRFDGEASRDPDGSVESWAWQVDGEDFAGPVFEHEFEKGGDYDVVLTVSDDEGATDSTDGTITVSLPNEAPEASFSFYCVENDCSFDASGSSDPDGEIVSWAWDLGDGNQASGRTLDHRYDEAGDHWVELTIEDDDGDTDSRGRSVTVTLPNRPPVASFAVNCDDLSCTVDAAASADPDGSITNWRWDFGDGNEATGVQAEHRYAAAGSFTIRLEVEDDEGATAASAQAVEASEDNDPPDQPDDTSGNQAPTAAFRYECSDGLCVFDASESTDGDGTLTAWSWNFGDGASASGPSVEHRYDEGGTYVVLLEVRDNDGASDSKFRYLDVRLDADEPVADFSVQCEDRVCSLDAGSSKASDGSIASYDWSFGDGATATGGAVTHEYAHDGHYTVTLKVTDSNKSSGVSKRTIEVVAGDPLTLLATLVDHKRSTALLEWSGARDDRLTVFRDGQRVATVRDLGKFLDREVKASGPSVRYRVCETSGERCSNPVKLMLGK